MPPADAIEDDRGPNYLHSPEWQRRKEHVKISKSGLSEERDPWLPNMNSR